jgi:hypothetical protein
MSRHWACLLFTAALLSSPLSAQEPGKGDPRPSHRLDLFPMPSGDLEKLLRERLADKRNGQIATKLNELGIKPETLDQLKDPKFLKELEKFNFDNPLLPPNLRDMLKGMKPEDLKEKLNPETLDQIKEKLQQQQPDPQEGIKPPPQSNETPPPEKNEEASSAVGPAGPNIPPGMERPGRSDAKDADTTANSRLGRFLERIAQKVEPKFRDSQAGRRFMRSLGEHMGEKDPRWAELSRGASAIADRWSTFSRSLHLEQAVPEHPPEWLARLVPQSWPSLNLGAHLPTVAPPPMPNMSSVDGPRQGGGISWLLGMAGIAGVAVLVWRFFGRYLVEEDPIAKARRQLGPWPVQPSAVASKEDLIRAFEYLSVLRIGPEARNWNHRHIAQNLGTGNRLSSRRDSQSAPVYPKEAEELASLYERARYTPPEDSLPESAFMQARHDIRLLAGVKGS